MHKTGQQVVWKLKLVLVSTCTLALLHSGDDWDVWEHWFRQETLLAGRGSGQKRFVVTLGQTLGLQGSKTCSSTGGCKYSDPRHPKPASSPLPTLQARCSRSPWLSQLQRHNGLNQQPLNTGWLKDTGTEGPSESDYSQRDPDFTGDRWSLSSHRLVLHRIRGLWYEVEPAGRENGVLF
ncbi:hypothetical protein EYF80_036514 [Liparis tanakae]|uniref:Uncharacterized protein n=1 Tax=Liparis tanakae TaxID=230148 RepID=A0A4Z2GJ16_9TELE|nr:hypothetical protein EYF80_036514 [Liparis tanakae]